MKKIIVLFFTFLILNGCNKEDMIQSGDIIFHITKTDQSEAVRVLTGSKYTHVGVIMQDNDGYYNVFETADRVRQIPLKNFIDRGEGAKFTVMRVKDFTPADKKPLKEAMKKFMNKPYDYYFQWSSDELYSSEFVYKVFEEAMGIKLGEFTNFGDFDLTTTEVKDYLDVRFPQGFDKNEPVLSPEALSKSPNLQLMYSNLD